MADDRGYLRYPTIRGDVVVFVAEDDLWSVVVGGGRAWRLTAGVAEVSHPSLSPDGSQVAFIGRDEGPGEVYVMPAAGGATRRLTFEAARSHVTGWLDDDTISYASNAGRPIPELRLRKVGRQGGPTQELPYGWAQAISLGPDTAAGGTQATGGTDGTPAGTSGRGVVLGRNTADPARWKRYRGGTAGELWVDPSGSGEFRRLLDLAGNIASPCWVGDRIYFLSDHEGVGNVYSCTPDGADLRRHSDHDDYYARNLATDGARLVYHRAGDLYLLDPGDEHPRALDVRLGSSLTQRNRAFVPAGRYLDTAVLGPDGSDLAITTRGKAYSFAHWEGAVRQHGEPDGVRYRFLTWLGDHERLVAAAGDDREEERLVILTADGSTPPRWLDGVDVGRLVELTVSPHADEVAVTNHRGELVLVDLGAETPTPQVLDRSEYGRIEEPTWAPDGRWLAYAKPTGPNVQAIMLCRVESGETWPVTRPVLRDGSPSFDPDGKYLYFLGQRDFNPVYDAVQFEAGFPLTVRPYAVTLRRDLGSPFVPEARPLVSDPAATKKGTQGNADKDDKHDDKHDDKENGEEEKKVAGSQGPDPVEIDVVGLADRVVAFPVPEGRYQKVAGLRGKVLFSNLPLHGSLDESPLDVTRPARAVLEVYDFDAQKKDRLVDGITDFWLDPGARTLLYRAGDRLRVLKAGEKPSDDGDEARRSTGWLDLGRVKVSVRPGAEWRQMFREAWRLQRDHFWVADMSGVAWAEIYARYLPLVDRVASRSELSDLIWELQGELGTSHAYELGGDYRPGPHYHQGFLGVDWDFDAATGRYRIGHVVGGDRWNAGATSPLNRPGVGVESGDVVLAINGQPIGTSADGTHRPPGEPLVNQADQEVQLTVVRPAESDRNGGPRTVTVRAVGSEQPGRYRDWVDANRSYVAEQTGGRVGYLHIPNMGAQGFAEFHRGFLQEYDSEGLIVDVRFNGGGNVSPLLIEKLARRRLGYNFPRWTPPRPYPPESPRGPLVAVTNALAGSDGDIFSHVWKMRQLGPLIGKRTWGGVIGIWPRHALADGTITTQPEYSFAFDDVGWGVENYGTDPDIDVDITPQDFVRGDDPQLDRAIAVALEALTVHPPHSPSPRERPRMAPPALSPRPQPAGGWT